MLASNIAAELPAADATRRRRRTVAVAMGDGIGPEGTEAMLRVLEAPKVPLDYDLVERGELAWRAGADSRVSDAAWETIRRDRVLLEGLLATPQGGGHKILCTLEDASHAADIHSVGLSRFEVGNECFTDAVIERLGRRPVQLAPLRYAQAGIRPPSWSPPPAVEERRVGVDVFVDWWEADRDAETLAGRLRALEGDGLELQVITHRGIKVWPRGLPETRRTDPWRCRFRCEDRRKTGHVLRLLARIDIAGIEVIKSENLYQLDGRRGFSEAQGASA